MELSKQALLSSLPSNYVNTLQTSEICENTLIIFGLSLALVLSWSSVSLPLVRLRGLIGYGGQREGFLLFAPQKSVYSLSGARVSPFMYQPRPTGLVSPLISQATPIPKAVQGVD